MRLDKFLVDMSIGSRSQVKVLIKKKNITVNGQVITKPETQINENLDLVCCNQKQLHYEKYQYYMLNKPIGVVSATKDNIDKTVIDLILQDKKNDLFPVGRLDKDTQGLILITNDGTLCHNLLSPKKHIPKTYEAIVEGKLTPESISLMENGMDIGMKQKTLPAKIDIIKVGECTTTVQITILEGKFHQVKRMFHGVGCKVMALKRLSMGSLQLDPSLELGQYRALTKEELLLLKQ